MIQELAPDFLRTRLSSKWSSFPADVIPSNPAEMDFGVAPAIQRRMQELVDKQQYGYGARGAENPMGLLVEAFVRRMRERFGFAAAAERVVVLNDLVQAVMGSVMAFAEPHQSVALQVPAYPAFLALLAQSGRPVVLNPMREVGGRYEIDAEALRAAVTPDTRILLLCHPHNPTGRAFGRAELAPLAALAIERDMVVVSDEIHADLMLDGRRHVPFAAMFPEAAERTVTLYSATKSFNIPGLRCGLMHFGSAALQERFNAKIPPFLLGTPSVTGVYATIAAWEEPEAWLDGLIRLIEANRDHLLARFAAELPEVGIDTPEATYLAWADFKALRLPERPYLYLLEKARVACGDGANFGPGYEDFVRLNVATSRAILDDKIDRVVRAVRSNAG